LSLRKTQAVRQLLGEFPETLHAWVAVGNPEDLFIALLGGLSKDFRIPNLRKAAAFAIELEPERMLFLNQGELPFGAHQWDRYGWQLNIGQTERRTPARALHA